MLIVLVASIVTNTTCTLYITITFKYFIDFPDFCVSSAFEAAKYPSAKAIFKLSCNIIENWVNDRL